jgi:cyclic pyranopterin phosphate synthase
MDAARDWDMDALVEVHDEAELERAVALDADLIGINNRNLKTFETRLETTEELARLVPRGRILVSESGIHTNADIARLQRAGVRAYLVGESLMRQADVAEATRRLIDPASAAVAAPASLPAGPKLTHIDETGAARMVDVSDKAVTERSATAQGFVAMAPATLALVTSGQVAKGDVLATARIAGIMAAKRTHELIPLCHPLPIAKATVDLVPQASPPGIRVTATVKVAARTGVEMEALTAVSIACLTIYDMLKSADRGIVIEAVRLLEKSGGRSGDWRATGEDHAG